MKMFRLLTLSLAGLFATSSLIATTTLAEETQEPETPEEKLIPTDPRSLGLSDEHMLELIKTVKLYVYGKPPAMDALNLFDPLTSEQVRVKHVKTHTTGDNLRNLGDGYLLICADFIYDGPREEVEEDEEIDTYQVGFLVTAETSSKDIMVGDAPIETLFAGKMKVEKAGILGKNGAAIREWSKGADGRWDTKLIVPEEEEETSSAE